MEDAAITFDEHLETSQYLWRKHFQALEEAAKEYAMSMLNSLVSSIDWQFLTEQIGSGIKEAIANTPTTTVITAPPILYSVLACMAAGGFVFVGWKLCEALFTAVRRVYATVATSLTTTTTAATAARKTSPPTASSAA